MLGDDRAQQAKPLGFLLQTSRCRKWADKVFPPLLALVSPNVSALCSLVLLKFQKPVEMPLHQEKEDHLHQLY